MEAQALTEALISKLKTVAVFGNRVYAVPSRLIFPKSSQLPLVLVIYRGGPVGYQKGLAANRFVHRFTIYVVNLIWREEAVILGIPGGQAGLIELNEAAMDALKDDRLSSRFALPTVTSLIGTEDYLQFEWYGASIGFEIEYLEVET